MGISSYAHPRSAGYLGAVTDQTRTRAHVLIAGGGVAALETLLALNSLAGHVIEITLVAPDRRFLYRPVTVAEAFDRGEARSWPLDELVTEEANGTLIRASLQEVLAREHVAVLSDGARIPFDVLVVAVGAVMTDALPGALNFRGREDVPALRRILDDLVDRTAGSIAFVLPSGRMWSLPLYELALLAAAHLRDRGAAETRLHLITPEVAPLELFGPQTAQAISPLLAARGIELHTASMAVRVEQREIVLAGGARVYADRVLTLPRLEGAHLQGLPCDAQGFIPVDRHGRVRGIADVFAAGDATAFPLKQGGLAAQQADAVAELIASNAGGAVRPRPFSPVLRGLLLTGGAPLYLRAEPQRLPHFSSVAIDAPPRRQSEKGASAAAGEPLWWPPAKIAGRYLAPFLATARPDLLSSETLTDRWPPSGEGAADSEQEDAVELALLLADCDARWGDYRSALDALDAAETLHGALAPEWESKRRAWRAAHQLGD
jgi:sulfide:quinone oxidoreductase